MKKQDAIRRAASYTKKKSENKSWSKNFPAGKGPMINGSELRTTTSTNRAIKEPEATPCAETI